jgi:hypothetical protein
MIYAYAITDPACAVPRSEARGLDDAPLATRTIGDVAVVYSAHVLRQIAPTPENLWRHEAVIESIMRAGDAVLPARFGTLFADDRALDDALSRHADALAAGLERVRGCVELGLRVMWKPPQHAPASPPSTISGRAYMLARLDEERRRRETRELAERIAADLHDNLAPLARDSTRRVLPTPDVLMSAAYLVPRDDAESFATRTRELSSTHPALRLLCTGPWPPYHFAPALPASLAQPEASNV